VYRVAFDDTPKTIDMYMGGVNPYDGSSGATYANEAAARVDVDRYTPRLGKLPLVYRRNIHHMEGLAGNGSDTGETTNADPQPHYLTVCADRMTVRANNNDMEETFFHEGTHASIQALGQGVSLGNLDTYNCLTSPEWLAAVAADGANGYITQYAKDNTGSGEDFAEHALFAYTMIFNPSRLPEPDRTWIAAKIPNRIAFFRTIFVPAAPPASATVPTGFTGTYTLLFEDTFTGSSVDLTKWAPNWFGATPTTVTDPINDAETAAYDPARIAIAGGTCTFTTAASPVTVGANSYSFRSGMLSSNGLFAVAPTAGKPVVAEARIWTDASTGTTIANWPQFWLTGQNWPDDGEIDIIEGLGGNAFGHFHYPAGGPGTSAPAGDNTGWHIWSARWTYQDKIEYARDGVVYGTITPRGSGYALALSAPKYILVNLGMGSSVGGPNKAPGTMIVDYVRVWRTL
jgi:hypothetical protein